MKKKIRKLLNEIADLDCSFKIDGKYSVTRKTDHIFQIIELQPGSGTKSNRFRINFGWQFEWNIKDNNVDTFAIVFDVSDLEGVHSDTWFNCTTEESAERSMAYAMKWIADKVIPFLNRYNSIRSLLNENIDYESSLDNNSFESLIFGRSIDWRHYNFGFALNNLGEIGPSKHHFKLVLEKYTDDRIPFQKERADRIRAVLSN